MPIASASLLVFGLMLLLAFFMLVSWSINKSLKNKSINGAKYYLITLGIIFIVHFVGAIKMLAAPISLLAVILPPIYILPVIAALYLMRKFNKKRMELNENS